MVVCLALAGSADYLETPIDGQTTIARLSAYCSGLPDVTRIAVVCPVGLSGVPDSWDIHEVPKVSERTLCDTLADVTENAETEILVAQLDEPFLNLDLTERMIERHRTHWADYTFADGYPLGLAPELVTGRVVSHLCSLATDKEISRTGLFPIVARDINRIDVETLLAAKDQRMLRLSLSVDTRANLKVCEQLAGGAPASIDEWETHAGRSQLLHRTLPRFLSVQVLEQEVQALSYSPYTSMRADVTAPGAVMSVDQFKQLVEELSGFSPECVVHLSLWGELALHPYALDLIAAVLSTPSLSVLIETSGIGWGERADALFRIADPRIRLIVGLDAAEPELYKQVRGDGFEEATEFATAAVEKLGSRAYVQAVRSETTEPGLEKFYKSWKERTENVIIQKYDHFCKRLPQIRVGDLSPVSRFPCWHLQRDMHVLVDGTVPLCREDINSSEDMGNIFSDGLANAWASAAGKYEAHVNGRFEGICGECDEYYTFSF
jgi:spiro-SPASM protein